MKLVNITNRSIYTTFTGHLGPGRTSADGGPERAKLEKVLSDIVKVCGNTFGIILNERETELIERLITLDEIGCRFNPSAIPASIRKDPSGQKRAIKEMSRRQGASIRSEMAKVRSATLHEARINGETGREPVGPATMKGEKVDPSKLKSGFEAILEENDRIAAGQAPRQSNPGEMLDPIGAHMKKEGAPEPEAHKAAGPADAAPVRQAQNMDGDAVRSADAKLPEVEVVDRAGAMDKAAAETARKLSVVGPATEPADEGTGKGRKGGRPRKSK